MDGWFFPDLSARRVLLGISGGIAAYKAAELCRLLVRCRASVRVMMTPAAQRFVSDLTFAALSGRPVTVDLFDPGQEAQIGHISLADEAELVVLAPATADLMAKLAHGLADDLVSTVCLAFTGPLLLAPAMNVHMWEHPATRENLRTLHGRGVRTVGPGSGEMACGHLGEGRMAEPEEIVQAVAACLAPQDLCGRTMLVSAGPTQEPLDPVRFLGNRSSGKMGFALATEAAARGARVTLVAGPCDLPTPIGVERVDVVTAEEMASAIRERAPSQDVVVMAAAVADYRPSSTGAATKIKKELSGSRLVLELTQTEDILGGLGKMQRRPFLVGFAAETGGDLAALAAAKLAAKGCDLLVANDVLESDTGFGSETNRVLIQSAAGTESLPLLGKRAVAAHILARVASELASRPRR